MVRGVRIVAFVVAGVLVALAVVSLVGQVRWARAYGSPSVPSSATIDAGADAGVVERGRHLSTVLNCRYCHGDDLAGGPLLDVPVLATVYAPNLTSGAGGVGAVAGATDAYRALRHGVGHDGRGLVGMPARVYARLTQDDQIALASYLAALEPVDRAIPPRRLGPLGRILVALGAFPPSEPTLIDHASAADRGSGAEDGAYLALVCTTCHGPDLNGGEIRNLAGDLVPAPNLTPGGRLAGWTEAGFARTLRTGVTPDGRRLSDDMPWRYVGQLDDEEMGALWRHLSSLPPREPGTGRADF